MKGPDLSLDLQKPYDHATWTACVLILCVVMVLSFIFNSPFFIVCPQTNNYIWACFH